MPRPDSRLRFKDLPDHYRHFESRQHRRALLERVDQDEDDLRNLAAFDRLRQEHREQLALKRQSSEGKDWTLGSGKPYRPPGLQTNWAAEIVTRDPKRHHLVIPPFSRHVHDSGNEDYYERCQSVALGHDCNDPRCQDKAHDPDAHRRHSSSYAHVTRHSDSRPRHSPPRPRRRSPGAERHRSSGQQRRRSPSVRRRSPSVHRRRSPGPDRHRSSTRPLADSSEEGEVICVNNPARTLLHRRLGPRPEPEIEVIQETTPPKLPVCPYDYKPEKTKVVIPYTDPIAFFPVKEILTAWIWAVGEGRNSETPFPSSYTTPQGYPLRFVTPPQNKAEYKLIDNTFNYLQEYLYECSSIIRIASKDFSSNQEEEEPAEEPAPPGTLAEEPTFEDPVLQEFEEDNNSTGTVQENPSPEVAQEEKEFPETSPDFNVRVSEFQALFTEFLKNYKPPSPH